MSRTRIPLDHRFWAKVEKTPTCWIWTAAKNALGYGQFNIEGRPRKAHRVSYELLVGPIPEGLVLDHLCRNPSCVRPDHLEPVEQRENCRRGIAGEVAAARGRAMTHCKRGHVFSDENTGINVRGHRVCRTCARAATARNGMKAGV